MTNVRSQNTWNIRNRELREVWQVPLVAVWEVNFSAMSDDYTPEEICAEDLLHEWAKKVQVEYPDGLIPIYWFVDSPGHAKFERMPFEPIRNPDNLDNSEPHEDFLTFFTWPTHPETGEALNWLSLPVVDRRWDRNRADKGGFIQEATGWKPSILQPTVYLPALLSIFR